MANVCTSFQLAISFLHFQFEINSCVFVSRHVFRIQVAPTKLTSFECVNSYVNGRTVFSFTVLLNHSLDTWMIVIYTTRNSCLAHYCYKAHYQPKLCSEFIKTDRQTRNYSRNAQMKTKEVQDLFHHFCCSLAAVKAIIILSVFLLCGEYTHTQTQTHTHTCMYCCIYSLNLSRWTWPVCVDLEWRYQMVQWMCFLLFIFGTFVTIHHTTWWEIFYNWLLYRLKYIITVMWINTRRSIHFILCEHE
jgi:hypothetical protein